MTVETVTPTSNFVFNLASMEEAPPCTDPQILVDNVVMKEEEQDGYLFDSILDNHDALFGNVEPLAVVRSSTGSCASPKGVREEIHAASPTKPPAVPLGAGSGGTHWMRRDANDSDLYHDALFHPLEVFESQPQAATPMIPDVSLSTDMFQDEQEDKHLAFFRLASRALVVDKPPKKKKAKSTTQPKRPTKRKRTALETKKPSNKKKKKMGSSCSKKKKKKKSASKKPKQSRLVVKLEQQKNAVVHAPKDKTNRGETIQFHDFCAIQERLLENMNRSTETRVDLLQAWPQHDKKQDKEQDKDDKKSTDQDEHQNDTHQWTKQLSGLRASIVQSSASRKQLLELSSGKNESSEPSTTRETETTMESTNNNDKSHPAKQHPPQRRDEKRRMSNPLF